MEHDEIRRHLERILTSGEQATQALGRDGWILGPMGYALARAGRKVEAANIAREIESADGSPVSFAYVYAALGDKPRALDALERAYAQRIVDLNFMAVDPMLASLRGEPRFLALKRLVRRCAPHAYHTLATRSSSRNSRMCGCSDFSISAVGPK